MELVQTIGAAIVVVLGVIAATPPAFKKLRPLFGAIRNYAFRDVLDAIKELRAHAKAKNPHLSRPERKALEKLVNQSKEAPRHEDA